MLGHEKLNHLGKMGQLEYTAPEHDNGYQVISVDDACYPEKISSLLGSKTPSQLYYKGNLALLDMSSVGFCGSRNASLKGLETAEDCASQIASEKLVVVSGYAAGIDMAAHYAALNNGGYTIFVLPEGISNFRIKKELQAIWDWSRVLVLSQYEPQAAWQAYRAMERNKLIIALSDVMVVIEAGEKGGTMNAGQTTLKLGRPLYVAFYDNEHMATNASGNKQLLQGGARRLCRSYATKKAQLSGLLEQVVTEQRIYHGTQQPSLF